MANVSEAEDKMRHMDWVALKLALEQNIRGIAAAHLGLLEEQAFDGETMADTDQPELERWKIPIGIAKKIIKWRDSMLGKGEELHVFCDSLLPLWSYARIAAALPLTCCVWLFGLTP
jgi:hypothetical protein